MKKEGFTFEEIKSLFESRSSNYLESKDIMPFDKVNTEIWGIGAEIFVPAAASRLLSEDQLDMMISNKLETP